MYWTPAKSGLEIFCRRGGKTFGAFGLEMNEERSRVIHFSVKRGWRLWRVRRLVKAAQGTNRDSAVCTGLTGVPLTYLLTPWCRILLEKLTGLQLVKKFPSFHGTRKFITALTSVRHLSLSSASPIQSIYPHPTSWRSILIFSTHLRLGLPSGLLPSGFPTKILYTPLSSPIRTTCPAHLRTASSWIYRYASLNDGDTF